MACRQHEELVKLQKRNLMWFDFCVSVFWGVALSYMAKLGTRSMKAVSVITSVFQRVREGQKVEGRARFC